MIKKLVAKMSLEEKIGQLFFCNIKVPNKDKEGELELATIEKAIRDNHIGGLLVFHGDARETASLLNRLQSISKLPLLVASDIERGAGQMFAGLLEFPTNMAIGATNNPNMAYLQGKIVAKEARLVGIHSAYAPVCDINTNPHNPIINTRSYGDMPDKVSTFVREYIRGLQESGRCFALAKHFPGHGSLTKDSHAELPILEKDKKALYETELIPFKAAIEENVSQIMTAHIALPKITGKANEPATLSYSIINGILKKELGFKGLVVSDALNMEAITKFYSLDEAVVLAIKAGIDILLYPKDLPLLVSAIKKAILTGFISIEQINSSVIKILTLKEKALLFKQRQVNIEELEKYLAMANGSNTAYLIAKESLTLVGDKDGILPLNAKTSQIRCVVVDEDKSAKLSFVDILKQKASSLEIIKEDTAYDRLNFNDTLITIIIVYSKVKAWKKHSGLSLDKLQKVNLLLEKNEAYKGKAIIISFGTPYIYNAFDKDRDFIFIAAYSDCYYSQIACANALFSTAEFTGKMPVSLQQT